MVDDLPTIMNYVWWCVACIGAPTVFIVYTVMFMVPMRKAALRGLEQADRMDALIDKVDRIIEKGDVQSELKDIRKSMRDIRHALVGDLEK